MIYFLGIGGIGMSALVRYFIHQGKAIHGYDLTPTPLTRMLEKEGAIIHYQEDVSRIPSNTDLVIYTPAIPKESAELAYLKSSAIPLFKRAEIVGLLTKNQFTVAVAGTHGKTSISALTAHVFKSAGRNITAFVGGIMRNYQSNIIISKNSEVLLVEADEFDRSFLQIEPNISLISSMDADHLDIYGHHDELIQNFETFATRLPEDGKLIYHDDIEMKDVSASMLSYGLHEDSDIQAKNIRIEEGQFLFDISAGSLDISNIKMEIPGVHYVENATAAAAIALQMELSPAEIKTGLESFSGVERRFEFRINSDKIVFIDDYAHHPEEIKATLTAVRQLFPERKITGIFQPHLYSRTRDFAEGFSSSLELLDEAILLPIYPAREQPIQGITSKLILDKMKSESKIFVEKEGLPDYIKEQNIDVLVTMGAGDIGLMIDEIESILKKRC